MTDDDEFEDMLTQPAPKAPAPAPDDLDHKPLTFGEYQGKTPDQVSEIDEPYIRWLYETVTDRPTCSKLLYEACKPSRRAREFEEYEPEDHPDEPRFK